MGNFKYDPNDDYTDFAKLVAQKVSEKPEEHKGILICGSGVGVDITANKFHGVRSALADDIATAKQSRQHDDTNVLSLPADEMGIGLAKKSLMSGSPLLSPTEKNIKEGLTRWSKADI